MTQQLSFDPLDYEGFDDVPAATLAKKDRDEAYRNLKHCGNLVNAEAYTSDFMGDE